MFGKNIKDANICEQNILLDIEGAQSNVRGGGDDIYYFHCPVHQTIVTLVIKLAKIDEKKTNGCYICSPATYWSAFCETIVKQH